MTDVLKELKNEIEAICEKDELPLRAVKILQWIAEQALTQDGVIDEGELYSQLVRLEKASMPWKGTGGRA